MTASSSSTGGSTSTATAGSKRPTDPFGNTVHSFTVEGPLDGLVDHRRGRGRDAGHATASSAARSSAFPPAVFLRETALTDVRRRRSATSPRRSPRAAGRDRLDVFHALMVGIRERMRFDVERDRRRHQRHRGLRASATASARTSPMSSSPPPAISASRPAMSAATSSARHEPAEQEAGHAWAEALIDDLGWVGFDPANGICPTDAYVRVAVGLDYLGAAPVRGTRYGGSGETPAVRQGDRPRRGAASRPIDHAALFPIASGRVGPKVRAVRNRGAGASHDLLRGHPRPRGTGDDRRHPHQCRASTTSPPSASSTSSRRRASGRSASPRPATSPSAQSVVTLVTEGFENPETGEVETLMNVPTHVRRRPARRPRHPRGASHRRAVARSRASPAPSTCRSCSAARSRAAGSGSS